MRPRSAPRVEMEGVAKSLREGAKEINRPTKRAVKTVGKDMASSNTPFYATDLGVARPERVDVGRDPICGVDPYRPTVVGLEASVYDLCDRLPCRIK